MPRLASAGRVCSGIALCIVLGACARPASSTSPGTIRVGYAGETDFGDLPSLMAHARMRDLGHEVDVTHFMAPDLAIEAVSHGSVDIVHGSMVSAWVAASRGAPIRTVMDHVANPYRLVVAQGISACAELSGRRLAMPGESNVSTYLVRGFLEEECPAVQPDIVHMMESTNRAAALLAGGVDAAGLELSVMLWLEEQAPGRFRVLSDFSTRWPLIRTTGVHVNAAFAAAHPGVVRDYLRAQLDATREVKTDPALVIPVATEELGVSDKWVSVATMYRDGGLWPEDGGLTPDAVARTLAFFKSHGVLSANVSPETVVDMRFLAEALAVEGK
jgi:ABC-type nitrate/sulfonate/bicarbonate transport system substrate-binding protein